MKYIKLLLLAMSVMAITMSSQAKPKRHGHHRHHMHATSEQSSEEYNPEVPRERRHGRGFHGQGAPDQDIPGFPMKGPPSPPYVIPAHGRGHGSMGGMQGPPPHRGGGPGAGNTFPPNNYGPPQLNAGQRLPASQFPLRTNNFPTNVNPSVYPENNEPRRENYNNNPFLNPVGQNPQGPQGNFVPRPPQPPLQPSNNNVFTSPQQQPLKPNPNFNINNLPAIEPVTNDLPASESPYPGSTTKPTINPRTFDLLAGSNLYDETTAKTTNLQPQGKSLEPESVDLGTRILLDSVVQCKTNEVLVNNTCRPRV